MTVKLNVSKTRHLKTVRVMYGPHKFKYLVFQEKRLRFPRFYFLGDEDLLEILGQANKQHVIQSHLKKLFSGIHSVVFRYYLC